VPIVTNNKQEVAMRDGIQLRGYLDGAESGLLQEPGKYVCEIEDMEERPTRKGDNGVMVKFRVAEGDQEGKLLFSTFAMTPKAMFRFVELINACGFDEAQIESSKELIGSRLLVQAREGEFEGKKRLNVASCEAMK
jgi:hypothetical protein